MNSQNEVLRTQLKESKTYEKALQQQISKAEERNEKLEMFCNAKQVEDQLSSMQRKLTDIKFNFECVDVIKIKYIEEVMFICISIFVVSMVI